MDIDPIDLPAAVGALIEEFVLERRYVPGEAYAVRCDDLPACLHARIQDMPADAHWRAWSNGCQIWFIVGQWMRAPHEDAREVVLKMTFHDQDGARAACAAWARRPNGTWLLHSVPADPH